MYFMEKRKISLSITDSDLGTLTLDLDGDISGDKIVDMFRLIMKFLTYGDETIDKFLPDDEVMEEMCAQCREEAKTYA